jgi:hypothetical protein
VCDYDQSISTCQGIIDAGMNGYVSPSCPSLDATSCYFCSSNGAGNVRETLVSCLGDYANGEFPASQMVTLRMDKGQVAEARLSFLCTKDRKCIEIFEYATQDCYIDQPSTEFTVFPTCAMLVITNCVLHASQEFIDACEDGEIATGSTVVHTSDGEIATEITVVPTSDDGDTTEKTTPSTSDGVARENPTQNGAHSSTDSLHVFGDGALGG